MKTIINIERIISAQTESLTATLGYDGDFKNIDTVNDFLKNQADFSDLHNVYRNHFYNCQLWKREDIARDTQATDSIIADVKRDIDKLNQNRNDHIERINDEIIEFLPTMDESTEHYSETPGSIIDRLSILSLKIFHMNKSLETARSEGKADFAEEVEFKYKKLQTQQNDLKKSFEQMISNIQNGNMHFKTYYQFKMYNDKRFNKLIKD